MAALNTSGSCSPGIATRLTPPPPPPPSPPPPSPSPPIVLFETESSKYLTEKDRKGGRGRGLVQCIFPLQLASTQTHSKATNDTTRPCYSPCIKRSGNSYYFNSSSLLQVRTGHL